MTRRHTRFILAALLGGVLTLPVTASQQTDLQVVLRRAIEMETVDGDPRGAIEQYKKVAESSDRALATAALLRMAGAYEKFDEEKARETYQRIVSQFADQRTQAAEAQARLDALAPTAGPGSSRRQDLQSYSTWDGGLGPGKDTAFSVSADGQRFVYTDWETGDLARSDYSTGKSSRFYGTDYDTEFYQRPVLSPDGRRVAFAHYPNTSAGRIVVDDFEGGARHLVYDESDLGNILIWDWSPDGTRVLLSHTEDQVWALATLDVDDGTLDPLLTLNWEEPRRAEYSPDGRFIAYDSSKGGDRAIYLIDVASGTETVLVDSQGEDDFPMWTADGRFLVFRTNRRGDWDLFGLAMDGRPADDAQLLESGLGQFSTLRGISDDGRLFVHERLDGESSIGLASSVVDRVDTLEVTDVPKVGTNDQQRPVFGPNSQQVIFGAGRRLQAADLDGQTRQMAELEPGVNAFYPASVSPDGKELAVIAYGPGGRQLLIRSADSGEPLRAFLAPEGKTFALPVRWSADQRTLYAVLFTTGGGGREVAVVDSRTGKILETTSVRTVTAFSPNLESFTYHDGASLIVRSLVDDSERAYSTGPSALRGVVWTPDSRSLLLVRSDDDALYALDVDTGQERVLVTDLEGWIVRATSPDGKHWALVRSTGPRARVWFLENFLPAPGGQTSHR